MEFLTTLLGSTTGETSMLKTLTEFLSHHLLFNLGILLLCGYFFGKLAQKVKLPAITGYIISGLIMGESMLNLVSSHLEITFNHLTEIALSLIALTIGAEFNLAKLKNVGTRILILTVFEALFAFIMVSLVFFLIGTDIKYSLLLGAISAATAPAATVVIIRDLRARGPFIDYLYGVVAFDDAVCVILFSIVFSAVSPLLAGTLQPGSSHGILNGLFHASIDLLGSLLIGLVTGLLLHLLVNKKHRTNEIMILSVGIIFLCTSLTISLKLSPLIANMVLGAMIVNLSNKNKKIFSILEPVTPPLFALFFILAGWELNVDILTKGTVVLYGLLYIFFRFGGKLLGIYLASFTVEIPPKVKKFLGLCLFPQAGVAIGLVLFVKTSPVLVAAPPEIRNFLDLILNIILVSVFINELVGPVISRYGIVKGADL